MTSEALGGQLQSCYTASARPDLIMRTHVQRTVSQCFAALRKLRQIRRSVPPVTFQSLVVTLVLTRLDYGNAVLVGLPTYLVRRLVSTECCRTGDLSPAICRSHH